VFDLKDSTSIHVDTPGDDIQVSVFVVTCNENYATAPTCCHTNSCRIRYDATDNKLHVLETFGNNAMKTVEYCVVGGGMLRVLSRLQTLRG